MYQNKIKELQHKYIGALNSQEENKENLHPVEIEEKEEKNKIDEEVYTNMFSRLFEEDSDKEKETQEAETQTNGCE